MANSYLDVIKVVHEERVAVADFLLALVKFDLVKKEEAVKISYSYSNALDDALRRGDIRVLTGPNDEIKISVKYRDHRMWEK